MDFNFMYADSNEFHQLQEAFVPGDTENLLLAAQLSVNAFISNVGNLLHSNFEADTFLMLSPIFGESQNQIFSIVITLRNRDVGTLHAFSIIFRLVAEATDTEPAGLYLL